MGSAEASEHHVPLPPHASPPSGGPDAALEPLQRLQRFTADLSAAVTMRDVARVLLEQGLAHFGARAAGIVWMIRPHELRLVFGQGLTEREYRELDDLSRAGHRLPIRDAIVGRRSVWLETPDELRAHYPALEPLRARRGESGCAVVPLVVGDRCPGIIGFTFDRQAPFAEDERILIETLARLAAEAFERARLLEAEQEARADAEGERALLERFLAVIGHDLRTPLGAVRLAAENVRRQGALSPVQERALDLLQQSAGRMSRILEDLGDFSAARSGLGIALRLGPTDLGLLAQRALEELDASAGAGRVALALEGDLRLDGDADRLMQVLSNLIGNALQHGDGTPVRVEARGEGAELCVRVQNGGRPIQAERLRTLFEPFRRGEGGGATRSLGLGLYIVAEIVHAHGGQIAARSDERRGTELEVVLPRRPAPRAEAPVP